MFQPQVHGNPNVNPYAGLQGLFGAAQPGMNNILGQNCFANIGRMLEKSMRVVSMYQRPRNASAGCQFEWVMYRIWNAIKSIIGLSDWQVARRGITNQIVRLGLCNRATAKSAAQTIMLAMGDERLIRSLGTIKELFGSILPQLNNAFAHG